ncbi:MAG TPA: ion channel [Gaiellaceae bacterium]|nr:ion channel [Gaiellaceae bacterium]
MDAKRVWQTESGKVRHPFELVVLACSVLMLPAVLIQDSKLHSPWGDVADAFGALVWAVFLVELAFTLHRAPDKRAALRAHWHDVLVVLVIFPAWASLFSALGPGWLRGWRLARLWAIVARLFRAERLLSRRQSLPYLAALTAVLVVAAGIGISETDPTRFPNPWRGLWWAVVTVTTVGYGDTFPTSNMGRVLAGILMVIGIGFLGLATASIASHFVHNDDKQRELLAQHGKILATLERIEARLAALERSTTPR